MESSQGALSPSGKNAAWRNWDSFKWLVVTFVLPLTVFTYNWSKESLRAAREDHLRHEQTRRVAIYRLFLIEHALRDPTYETFKLARGALEGGGNGYIPLLPEYEKDIPLAGLLLRIVPEKALHFTDLPWGAYTCQTLEDRFAEILDPLDSREHFSDYLLKYHNSLKTSEKWILQAQSDAIAWK